MLTDQEAQEIHTISIELCAAHDDLGISEGARESGLSDQDLRNKIRELENKMDVELNRHTAKAFLCLWEKDSTNTAIHKEGWFHEDLGYETKDILAIRNLNQGEILDLSDGISQEHFIVRIN